MTLSSLISSIYQETTEKHDCRHINANDMLCNYSTWYAIQENEWNNDLSSQLGVLKLESS